MKARKVEKKLTLSKTTVANLENEELNAIKGGTGSTKLYNCPSILRTDCCSSDC